MLGLPWNQSVGPRGELSLITVHPLEARSSKPSLRMTSAPELFAAAKTSTASIAARPYPLNMPLPPRVVSEGFGMYSARPVPTHLILDSTQLGTRRAQTVVKPPDTRPTARKTSARDNQ